jgi:hypothetical protein
MMEAGESFYIIGALPTLPDHWTLELELPCAQLLAPEDPGILPPVQEDIVLLGEPDKDEMFQLINRVQPGYYHPDTRQLGDYFGIRVESDKYPPDAKNGKSLAFGPSVTDARCGIRQEGRLVAMAGERMHGCG